MRVAHILFLASGITTIVEWYGPAVIAFGGGLVLIAQEICFEIKLSRAELSHQIQKASEKSGPCS